MQATRSRLGRLEQTASAGARQIAFLVYGRTDAERERAIERARAVGTVRAGDLVVRGEWTRPGEPPSPRWIAEDENVRADLDILSPQIVIVARGQDRQQAAKPSRAIETLSSAQLLAAALGAPLSA